MQEVDFRVPPSAQLTHADLIVESACVLEGLQVGMKGTLASFPGSTHWHFKSSRERGTLEITLFPRDRRIWASIQDGRRAAWIEPCLINIRHVVEEKLQKSPKRTSLKKS
jgi:hypothetical protein